MAASRQNTAWSPRSEDLALNQTRIEIEKRLGVRPRASWRRRSDPSPGRERAWIRSRNIARCGQFSLLGKRGNNAAKAPQRPDDRVQHRHRHALELRFAPQEGEQMLALLLRREASPGPPMGNTRLWRLSSSRHSARKWPRSLSLMGLQAVSSPSPKPERACPFSAARLVPTGT